MLGLCGKELNWNTLKPHTGNCKQFTDPNIQFMMIWTVWYPTIFHWYCIWNCTYLTFLEFRLIVSRKTFFTSHWLLSHKNIVNSLPQNAALWHNEDTCLWKILWTSNFTFSHNVFYPTWHLFFISVHFKMLSAISLNLDRSKILVMG